ncbi:MAG: methyltransferase domain-containing protein [Pseudomonadota bacterium]
MNKSTPLAGPDDILPTYTRIAERFDRERDCSVFERAHLETVWNAAPGPRVLDLGCGSGRPIATWFTDQGAKVTSVDGAPSMIALFNRYLPDQRGIVADMRDLDLGETFDAVLAFNSLFHLRAEDQRSLFQLLARHCKPRAHLFFSSGHSDGEDWGKSGGAPVYHASLAPEVYRRLLIDNGFSDITFQPNDPTCRHHCLWHATFIGNTAAANSKMLENGADEDDR